MRAGLSLRVHPRRRRPEALGAALRLLTDAGVRSLVSRPPTLEELFLRHYAQR
jgi:hypothetical protein